MGLSFLCGGLLFALTAVSGGLRWTKEMGGWT
jgi:hypothetical protein